MKSKATGQAHLGTVLLTVPGAERHHHAAGQLASVALVVVGGHDHAVLSHGRFVAIVEVPQRLELLVGGGWAVPDHRRAVLERVEHAREIRRVVVEARGKRTGRDVRVRALRRAAARVAGEGRHLRERAARGPDVRLIGVLRALRVVHAVVEADRLHVVAAGVALARRGPGPTGPAGTSAVPGDVGSLPGLTTSTTTSTATTASAITAKPMFRLRFRAAIWRWICSRSMRA